MIDQVLHANEARSGSEAHARLCRLDELPVGLGRAFQIDGKAIAVFRTRSDKLFALDNDCPHKGGPLAEGMLAGESVVCPLHAFRFEMHSGHCEHAGVCSVATYPVVQREGDVYISLPARGS